MELSVAKIRDKIFHTRGGLRQRFYVGNGGDVTDVDGEEDVREANILLSEGNKLSAGGRIFRGSRILDLPWFYFPTHSFRDSGRCPK